MCNIAGYIGNKRAAPILIEMMKKQSGFGAGYYTGIATLHEGKLYTAKVAGDMDKFLAETDAMNLPGNIGFLHGRSFGKQNVEWGHPFYSDNGRMAYIANGIYGKFFEDYDLSNVFAKKMVDEGFTFRTATPNFTDYKTVTLPNGDGIHGSELAAHMIVSYYRKYGDFAYGMMKSMADRPTEIVGLALHEDFMDTIFVTRFNYPMMTARADDEMFLATTAMVFPKDRKYYSIEPLPCHTTCEIKVDSIKTINLDPMPVPVKPITSKMWHDAYEICYHALKAATAETPIDIGVLITRTNHLWDDDKLNQDAMLVYEVMRALDDEGLLKIVKVPQEGSAPGVVRTSFHMYIH